MYDICINCIKVWCVFVVDAVLNANGMRGKKIIEKEKATSFEVALKNPLKMNAYFFFAFFATFFFATFLTVFFTVFFATFFLTGINKSPPKIKKALSPIWFSAYTNRLAGIKIFHFYKSLLVYIT